MSIDFSDSTLHYSLPSDLRIVRKKVGKGFTYLDEKGHKINNSRLLSRIKTLVIPPAWQNVLICACDFGHIQAIGIDAKGRKQYVYHSEWTTIQQQNKFSKMSFFGEVLPEIRHKILSDMKIKGLKRERVISTVVWLLENTFIRVGNKEYAKQNNSYGLTTLREKHVEVEGNEVSFEFKGKSGVYHSISINNPRVARTIKQCIELPGYELFQYIDDDGKRQQVDSRDVNAYLKQITGEDITAKDFRTWGGTILAGDTLYTVGPFTSETSAKKNITQAVKNVTKHLRNTPATCRSYYIHPTIIQTYQKELLIPHYEKIYSLKKYESELNQHEYAAWTLLKEFTS